MLDDTWLDLWRHRICSPLGSTSPAPASASPACPSSASSSPTCHRRSGLPAWPAPSSLGLSWTSLASKYACSDFHLSILDLKYLASGYYASSSYLYWQSSRQYLCGQCREWRCIRQARPLLARPPAPALTRFCVTCAPVHRRRVIQTGAHYRRDWVRVHVSEMWPSLNFG